MYQTSLAHQRPRGLTSTEIKYVLDKRDAHLPDGAIAKMLGRPLEIVRAVKAVVKDDAPMPLPAPKPTKPVPPMPPQAAEVFRRITEAHELTVEAIIGRKKNVRLNAARLHLYAELREFGYSFYLIGKWCGGRDHSTISQGALAYWKRGAA